MNKDTFLIEKNIKTAYHFTDGGLFQELKNNEIHLNFFEKIVIKNKKASIKKIYNMSIISFFFLLILNIILYIFLFSLKKEIKLLKKKNIFL